MEKSAMEIIREVMRLYHEGISSADIAKDFNAEMIPVVTPSGKMGKGGKWHTEQVIRIIRKWNKSDIPKDKPSISQSEIDDLKTRIDTLQSANKGYLAKIDSLQKENDALRIRAIESEQALENHESQEVRDLKAKNERLEKFNSEIQCQNAELEKAIQDKSDIPSISSISQSQIDDLKKRADTSFREMEYWKNKYFTLTKSGNVEMINDILARLETLEREMSLIKSGNISKNKPQNIPDIPEYPKRIGKWSISAKQGKKGGISYRACRNFGKETGIKTVYLGKSFDNAESILSEKEKEFMGMPAK